MKNKNKDIKEIFKLLDSIHQEIVEEYDIFKNNVGNIKKISKKDNIIILPVRYVRYFNMCILNDEIIKDRIKNKYKEKFINNFNKSILDNINDINLDKIKIYFLKLPDSVPYITNHYKKNNIHFRTHLEPQGNIPSSFVTSMAYYIIFNKYVL